ncbi:hypothetical protein DFQ30_000686 [Apophysomyces sp. BC1015]|nr:hypothetical protein DFQ30_000686 [Apophysomyces sp. BC1015]
MLATLGEEEKRPRAAVIRDAIGAYISQHKATLEKDVFGLWKRKEIDGLTYQQEPLFDTNILIDYLNGINAAKRELERYDYRAISTITWMEVLVGTIPEEEAVIRSWLGSFDVVPLNQQIASRAVEIRKHRKIRLPDAIVWASAQVNSLLLVSRNTKAFPADEPDVRVPYKI